MGIGDGALLRVDPELLSQYGGELEAAANDLPDAPPPFVVTGTDPISLAIAGKLPDIEGKIQEALPQIKTDAAATASNIVSAAGKYKGTDEQLAAEYEKHQFDQATSSGGGAAGSAGGGGGGGAMSQMSQMSQMMSMPMQMASQAAQMPMQAMSAVASAPQAVMQGVQQIGQMAGGLGKSDGDSTAASADAAEQKNDQHRDDEQKKQEPQPGAIGGTAHAERTPETAAAPPVPQQSSARHAASDPEVNL